MANLQSTRDLLIGSNRRELLERIDEIESKSLSRKQADAIEAVVKALLARPNKKQPE